MPDSFYSHGPAERTVRGPDGTVLPVPAGWEFFPPGDAALTRRVKAAGDHFVLQEKRRRKVFTLGIWASGETIRQIREDLVRERATEGYAKKLAAGAKRREQEQATYVEDFRAAIVTFLNFHDRHADFAQKLAGAVAAHATPVGSGTVARTKRIPIEARAEAAVIAWMRHQTTGYDSMRIARVKGERREVRRQLARRSHELLECYRAGNPIPATCPLAKALSQVPVQSTPDESLSQ